VVSDNDEIAATRLLSYAMRRAELLVERLWPKISIAAQQLLNGIDGDGVSRLNGDQIEKIIA
jgi:hypothetical protein